MSSYCPSTIKSNCLGRGIADFLCYDQVVIELKAIAKLTAAADAQLLNYLKTTGFKFGLVINFGAPSLEWQRLVSSSRWTPQPDRPAH